MKMNKQTTKMKKSDLIQFKLLIVPLFCLFMGIVAIGAVSSYLIRDSLLEELKNNGFTTSQRFVSPSWKTTPMPLKRWPHQLLG